MASRPTCYSLAVAALIALHCQKDSPLTASPHYDPAKLDAFLQKVLIDSNHQLLVDVYGASLQSLMTDMKESLGNELSNTFLLWLRTAASSIDALMDLMSTCRQALQSSSAAPPNVSGTSANGIYLRSVCLGFDELSFESVGMLWSEFASHVEAIYSNAPTMPPPTWPLSQSHMEQALLQEIRELSLHKSHLTTTPAQRDAQIQKILEHHPALPSAHFLKFWYSLEQGEHQAAVDALHAYLDTVVLQNDDMEILPFAAILAAAMYDSFGDKSSSLAATEEAVRVAQQSQDAACVAFALGWLGIHDNDSTGSQELIRKCAQRATEGNLRSLNAGASLCLAIQNVQQPSVAWSQLLKASTGGDNHHAADVSTSGFDRPTLMNDLSSGEKALEILARQRLVGAGIWDTFGHTTMSSMCSQVALTCHSEQLMSQDIVIAVQNVARCALYGCASDNTMNEVQTALQSHLVTLSEHQSIGTTSQCVYATALQKLMHFRELFKLPNHSVFRMEMMLLQHEWAVRRGDLIEAENLIDSLLSHLCPRIPNLEELKMDISTQRCLLLSRRGKWNEAIMLAKQLLAQCKRRSRLIRRARMLFLVAQLQLEAYPEHFACVLPYLMECLTISEKSHFQGIHACALMLLGHVHLRMDDPKRGLAIIRAALPSILQNEHVWIQGEAYLIMSRCIVQSADKECISTTNAAIKELQNSIDCFVRCQDCARLKEAYYMLARCYDCLPNKEKEREAAAEAFVKLSKFLLQSSQHRVDSSALQRVNSSELLGQLISQKVFVL